VLYHVQIGTYAMLHSVSVNHCPSCTSQLVQPVNSSSRRQGLRRLCGRPAAPNMLLREQKLSLHNVLSLSPVPLCGLWNTLPADLRFKPDTTVLDRNLKVTCFVLFLPSNFIRFNATILICYCTLFYVVINVD